ncbi:hypothetical protein [Deinococcus altitudinis]|uniref:hypothetical protein n=1 Tax=Deinococcus altitudinis TaxID=468914 RepID=UPI0038915D8E
MSRSNVTFDWLVATNPHGFLCGSTAANDAGVEATFTSSHEHAGHTVTRLTFQEAKDRLAACRAPARELYYAPRQTAPIARLAETVACLPAVTEEVQVALGVGIVMTHLRWPDHHPTHSGRVAALVVGKGFDGLAYPGQARPYRPPDQAPPDPDPPLPDPDPPPREQPLLQPFLF